MSTEIIKSGEWLFKEQNPPGYSIYKLMKGKVSIYKREKKIREMEVKEGMKPIMLGITAALRNDRQHMASVKAESDIEVNRIFIDHIKSVIADEIPQDIKHDISSMIESIVIGTEILYLISKKSNKPSLDVKIPDNVSTAASEILSEIISLYKLINADVARFCE